VGVDVSLCCGVFVNAIARAPELVVAPL